MASAGKDFSRPPAPRLFKKKVPDADPVTPESAALFRFGEQCNNDCPMCSNTGEAALFFHPTETLLRRADFLHSYGFRRAVVTGGEPTIHPGFGRWWSIWPPTASPGTSTRTAGASPRRGSRAGPP